MKSRAALFPFTINIPSIQTLQDRVEESKVNIMQTQTSSKTPEHVTKISCKKNILVSGATGYIGQKLVRRLQKGGNNIRCLIRRTGALKGNVSNQIQVTQGDLLNFESIKNAFTGIDTAFYLAHSLDKKKDFEKSEEIAAANFSRAAKSANIERIIYLGALGNPEDCPLSPHLKSRWSHPQKFRNSRSGISGIDNTGIRKPVF